MRVVVGDLSPTVLESLKITPRDKNKISVRSAWRAELAYTRPGKSCLYYRVILKDSNTVGLKLPFLLASFFRFGFFGGFGFGAFAGFCGGDFGFGFFHLFFSSGGFGGWVVEGGYNLV